MKILIALAVLAVVVVICDKNKTRLPTPIKQIYHVWELFSHILGRIMSFLILTVFWLLVIGIYALFVKIPTFLKARKQKTSYWIPAEQQTLDSLKEQF